jgi:hypothetical protein
VAETRNRWVVCEEYATGPFGETAAANRLAQIQADQAQGDRRTCPYPHVIVISEAKPVTAADRARELREREDRQDADGAHMADGS